MQWAEGAPSVTASVAAAETGTLGQGDGGASTAQVTAGDVAALSERVDLAVATGDTAVLTSSLQVSLAAADSATLVESSAVVTGTDVATLAEYAEAVALWP